MCTLVIDNVLPINYIYFLYAYKMTLYRKCIAIILWCYHCASMMTFACLFLRVITTVIELDWSYLVLY